MRPLPITVSAHSAVSPAAHIAQRSHDGTIVQITRSPTASSRTPGPVSTTTPAPSCPSTIGAGTEMPVQERQLGAAHTRRDQAQLDLAFARRGIVDLLDRDAAELAQHGGLHAAGS
jgi:hypothetical protein